MQWISDSIQELFGLSDAQTANLQTTGILTKALHMNSDRESNVLELIQEQILKFFEAGHKMFEDPG